MKRIGVLAMLALLMLPCRANDAYVRMAGGSVSPFGTQKSDSISMRSERIQIHLYKERYAVQVDFAFYNDGPEQTVQVGFPAWRNPEPVDDELFDFSTKVNGRDVPFSVVELPEPEELNPGTYLTKWYVRDVTFPARAVTRTTVSYSCRYGIYGAAGASADYLFGTGRSWSGAIGTMDIEVHNHAEEFRWVDDIYIAGRPEFEPRVEDDVIFIRLKDVLPAEDGALIEMTLRDQYIGIANPLHTPDVECNWLTKSVRLTERGLALKTRWQLRMLRNLIFAGNGHIFSSADINAFLSTYYAASPGKQDGWRPVRKVYAEDLTELERYNLALIQREERRR